MPRATENRSKYWCFTLNNYNEEQETAIQAMVSGESGAPSYVIYGREVGESGTRHLQGYIEFPKRLRFAQVAALLPGSHLERRRGSSTEAADYCKKEGSCYESGEISDCSPGQRTDLDRVEVLVKEGASLKRIAEEEFGSFVRFGKGIKEARMALGVSRDRNEAPEVYVYWGVTGAGKTRKVYDDNLDVAIYAHPGGLWFDGYDGQEIALFDDFGGSEFKLTYLLKLLDRYPMKVPVKGSFVNWIPKKIFLTSNLDPATWYSNAHGEHQAALRRRFTSVQHFSEIFGVEQ